MVQVEVTDTFGGEANYAWVRRYEVADGTRRALVRRAKRDAGWTGIRCAVSEYGDMIEVRPSGLCQIMFLTFDNAPLTGKV